MVVELIACAYTNLYQHRIIYITFYEYTQIRYWVSGVERVSRPLTRITDDGVTITREQYVIRRTILLYTTVYQSSLWWVTPDPRLNFQKVATTIFL